mgnify:CR=1 FL=1
MKIREATPADAATLARLCMGVQAIHLAMEPSFFRKPTRTELVKFFRERLQEAGFVGFVALEDDAAVGYVLVHLVLRPAHVLVKRRLYAEIDQIHVDKRYRKKGVGRALIRHAIELAGKRGARSVELNVWLQNERAVAAFKALGFESLRQHMILRRFLTSSLPARRRPAGRRRRT